MLTMRCSNELKCSGLGDRVKGINTGFWLVRPSYCVPKPAAGCILDLRVVLRELQPPLSWWWRPAITSARLQVLL